MSLVLWCVLGVFEGFYGGLKVFSFRKKVS